ncbi:hypothetical protein [Listeria newyorkensis]|uniref:hypothetical protein n=1 Tax=Listeria newyorkensis TaxID=1497681 RepID=UPI00051DA834|nr:hypothetical protein [Listeria newyorkensis]KGL43642.1 hypothetical protein EP58_07860 [Listeria newyorkensis]
MDYAQDENIIDKVFSFLSIGGEAVGIILFIFILMVVGVVFLVFYAVCAAIVEERRHRWIGKIVQEEFNCRKEDYIILEPTNPHWKGVYDIIAFSSGTYYAIRFSASEPRKILIKEKLDSWKDV